MWKGITQRQHLIIDVVLGEKVGWNQRRRRRRRLKSTSWYWGTALLFLACFDIKMVVANRKDSPHHHLCNCAFASSTNNGNFSCKKRAVAFSPFKVIYSSHEEGTETTSFPVLTSEHLLSSTPDEDGKYRGGGRYSQSRMLVWPGWISSASRWFRGGASALSSTAAPNHTSTSYDPPELETKVKCVHHNDDDREKNHRPLTLQPGTPLESNVVTSHSSSVHLQLTDPALTDSTNGDSKTITIEDDVDEKAATRKCTKGGTTTTVTIHTYRDPTTNKTWKALKTSKRKFHAYLLYRGVVRSDLSATSIETVQQVLTPTTTATTTSPTEPTVSKRNGAVKRQETTEPPSLRDEWRKLWKEGQLLTDRTELLAVYPSDKQQKEDANHHGTAMPTIANNNQSPIVARKRGGFADLLHLYTDRLLGILRDEQEDALFANQHPRTATQHGDRADKKDSMLDLVGWLEANYGKELTEALQYRNFRTLNEREQLVKLKHFLVWFRSEFPYFYDRCGSCGASIKEANAAAPPVEANHGTTSTDIDGEAKEIDNNSDTTEQEDVEHQTFVGYIYPDTSELQGKASRTELYQCHICQAFTRFPRFNSATHVLEHRRGRCGEYSMLLFRFLRALHHECRWVVDWADHVWAELLLPASSNNNNDITSRRWVHLDPCEAAVDENFIYQDWGKKQTYILGLYLPPIASAAATSIETNGSVVDPEEPAYGPATTFPMIEDITQSYTRDSFSDICKRREESVEQVKSSINKAVEVLLNDLLQHQQSEKNNKTKVFIPEAITTGTTTQQTR